jgi:hypothetical protein
VCCARQAGSIISLKEGAHSEQVIWSTEVGLEQGAKATFVDVERHSKYAVSFPLSFHLYLESGGNLACELIRGGVGWP